MPDGPAIDPADLAAVERAVARTTASEGFGVTREGFVPKPFARCLAEKLALARELFDDAVDLGQGSVLRKVLELTALADADHWANAALAYDDGFVVTATAAALTALGEELGLPRPFLEAEGTVTLELVGDPPAGFELLELPTGARLLSDGGHHAYLVDTVRLSTADRTTSSRVRAFYPGPEHNLDPNAPGSAGGTPQRLVRWHPDDRKLEPTLFAAAEAARAAGSNLDVKITHNAPFTGGDRRWPDVRYRALLLRVPRSTWTADAIAVAASLVPGVRAVQVHDAWGGLDIEHSIFGNFNFLDRLFGSERDVASPYYLTVLVAPTTAAIWEGQYGLRAAVTSAIEDLRPISIFPNVVKASEVAVGVQAELVVRGLPLPSGPRDQVNASSVAQSLKHRLIDRIGRYVGALTFGEPVRASEVTFELMSEPGVVDVRNLSLLQYPPRLLGVEPAGVQVSDSPTPVACGGNVEVGATDIAVLVDRTEGLVIV